MSMYLKPCSEDELNSYLIKAGRTRSTDSDGITGKIVKECGDIIVKPLHFLVNQSLTEGFYPEALKISKVVPIFKKGDRDDIRNYRPISIISHFGKVFEYVYCKRLTDYLEINNLLSSHQFSFCKEKSTVQALFDALDEDSG